MNAILLALVLAAPISSIGPAAPKQTLTDAQIRSTVRAYLGSIDTPIKADRWQALGPRAETELLAVVNGSELPTRRAKAVDGISALKTAGAPALFTQLAGDDAQPLNVRYAALRGLGHVLPADKLLPTLQPLLEKANDSRIRAMAGEQLTRRAPAASCAMVRAQIAREPVANRLQFDRAREGCLGR